MSPINKFKKLESVPDLYQKNDFSKIDHLNNREEKIKIDKTHSSLDIQNSNQALANIEHTPRSSTSSGTSRLWRSSPPSSTNTSRPTTGPTVAQIKNYLRSELNLSNADAIVQGIFRDLTHDGVRGLYLLVRSGLINQGDVIDFFQRAGRDVNQYLALVLKLYQRGANLVELAKPFTRAADNFRSLIRHVRIGQEYEFRHHLILIDNLDPSRYSVSTNRQTSAGSGTRAQQDVRVLDNHTNVATVVEVKRRRFFEISDEDIPDLRDQIQRLAQTAAQESRGEAGVERFGQLEYVIDSSDNPARFDPQRREAYQKSIDTLVGMLNDTGLPYRIRIHTVNGVQLITGDGFRPYDNVDPNFRVSDNGRDFHRARIISIPDLPRRRPATPAVQPVTPPSDDNIIRVRAARDLTQPIGDQIDQQLIDGMDVVDHLLTVGGSDINVGESVREFYDISELNNQNAHQILNELTTVINHNKDLINDIIGDGEIGRVERQEVGETLKALLGEVDRVRQGLGDDEVRVTFDDFERVLRIVRNLNEIQTIYFRSVFSGSNHFQNSLMDTFRVIHELIIARYQGLVDNQFIGFEGYLNLQAIAAELPNLHPQEFRVGALPHTIIRELGLVMPVTHEDCLRMMMGFRMNGVPVAIDHPIDDDLRNLPLETLRNQLEIALRTTLNEMTIVRFMEMVRAAGNPPLLHPEFNRSYQILLSDYQKLVDKVSTGINSLGPKGFLARYSQNLSQQLVRACNNPRILNQVGIIDPLTRSPFRNLREVLLYIVNSYQNTAPSNLSYRAGQVMLDVLEERMMDDARRLGLDLNQQGQLLNIFNEVRNDIRIQARSELHASLHRPRVIDSIFRSDPIDAGRLIEIVELDFFRNAVQSFGDEVRQLNIRLSRRDLRGRVRNQLQRRFSGIHNTFLSNLFFEVSRHFNSENFTGEFFDQLRVMILNDLNLSPAAVDLFNAGFDMVRNRHFSGNSDGSYTRRSPRNGGGSIRVVTGPLSLLGVAIYEALERRGYTDRFSGAVREGANRVRSGLSRSWESGALSGVRRNLEQDSAHLRRSESAILDGVMESYRGEISRADAEYVVRFLTNPPNNPADIRVDVVIGDQTHRQVTMLELIVLRQRAEAMGLGEDGFKVIGPEQRIGEILEDHPRFMDEYQRVCGEVLERRGLFLTNPMGATLWCTSLQALSFALQGDLDKAMSAILIRDGIIGGLCDVTSRQGITGILDRLEKNLTKRLPCPRTERTLVKLRGSRAQLVGQLPNAISVAVMTLISTGQLSTYHLMTAGNNIVISQLLSNIVMRTLGKVSAIFRSSGMGMLIGGIIDVMIYPAMEKVSRMTEGFIERQWANERSEQVLLHYRNGVKDPMWERRFDGMMKRYDQLAMREGDLGKRMGQWQGVVSGVSKMVEGFDVHGRSMERERRVLVQMVSRDGGYLLESGDRNFYQQMILRESENLPKVVSRSLQERKYGQLQEELEPLRKRDPYLALLLEEKIAISQMQVTLRAQMKAGENGEKAKKLHKMMTAMAIKSMQDRYQRLREEFIEEIAIGMEEVEKKSLMIYVLYQQKLGDSHYDYLMELSWKELRSKEAWSAKENEIDLSFLGKITATERAVIGHLLSKWPRDGEDEPIEDFNEKEEALIGKLTDQMVEEWG